MKTCSCSGVNGVVSDSGLFSFFSLNKSSNNIICHREISVAGMLKVKKGNHRRSRTREIWVRIRRQTHSDQSSCPIPPTNSVLLQNVFRFVHGFAHGRGPERDGVCERQIVRETDRLRSALMRGSEPGPSE